MGRVRYGQTFPWSVISDHRQLEASRELSYGGRSFSHAKHTALRLQHGAWSLPHWVCSRRDEERRNIERSFGMPADKTVYAVIALQYHDEAYESMAGRKKVELLKPFCITSESLRTF